MNVSMSVRNQARSDIDRLARKIQSSTDYEVRPTVVNFTDRSASVKSAKVWYSCKKENIEASVSIMFCYNVDDTGELSSCSDYNRDNRNRFMKKLKGTETNKGVKCSYTIMGKHRIVAADEDEDIDDDFGMDDPMIDDMGSSQVEDPDSLSDQIDELADQVEDVQDNIDDIQEEDPNIDMENNIDNHYIVECQACHGIFISALVESDQVVKTISGVCPLCEKECEQDVKWVIKSVNDGDLEDPSDIPPEPYRTAEGAQ